MNVYNKFSKEIMKTKIKDLIEKCLFPYKTPKELSITWEGEGIKFITVVINLTEAKPLESYSLTPDAFTKLKADGFNIQTIKAIKSYGLEIYMSFEGQLE